ncbi:hypothetical protein WJX73_001333 [Symbiochloris irregularis]|uniref:Uncharacterized protein n=1 Tax=Symbiochloris irregularis TaxID=706552 RepID=A0AAW1PZG4_9CHLO
MGKLARNMAAFLKCGDRRVPEVPSNTSAEESSSGRDSPTISNTSRSTSSKSSFVRKMAARRGEVDLEQSFPAERSEDAAVQERFFERLAIRFSFATSRDFREELLWEAAAMDGYLAYECGIAAAVCR